MGVTDRKYERFRVRETGGRLHDSFQQAKTHRRHDCAQKQLAKGDFGELEVENEESGECRRVELPFTTTPRNLTSSNANQ
jgi:hypothetical protein